MFPWNIILIVIIILGTFAMFYVITYNDSVTYKTKLQKLQKKKQLQ